jgi:hypothetical protein
VVRFVFRFADGVHFSARLMELSGAVDCKCVSEGIATTPRTDDDSPSSSVAAAEGAAATAAAKAVAAEACGPWLAALFQDLVLNLDGCELSFRSLRVEGSGGGDGRKAVAAELVLELSVCVRSFPILNINFLWAMMHANIMIAYARWRRKWWRTYNA